MTLHLRSRTVGASLAVTVLFGLVLWPSGAANAAEQPMVDLLRVDALATAVNADRTTFGGVSIDEATGALTVRYARGAGMLSAQNKLTSFTGRHGRDGKQVRLMLVPVAHSLSELDAVRDKLVKDASWNQVAGKAVSQTYVDVLQNVVSIGVTALTPEITAAARSGFGDLVSLHVAARPDRTSRTDDFEPWTVGIRIWSPAGGCTSGFVIRNATSGLKRMVTAGHCGPAGTPWNNNGDPVGTTVSSTLAERGLDVSYIGGRTYEPWSYVGGPTSDVGQWITGNYLSLVGRKFCTNGATSGEVCTGTVTAIDACITFSDGITTCFLDVLTPDTAGLNMTRPGDSGGPIINIPSVSPGSILIGGIIIGGGGPGGNTFFHSYHYLIPAGWVFDHV